MRKILLAAVLALVALPSFAGVPKYDAQGRTVVAGEPSAAPVPISGTITTTPSGTQDTNLKQVNGATVGVGHGTAAGALRVELPTDGTGTVGLNAGSAIIGKAGIDQTTPGTTNGVVVNSSALPTGAATATNQTAPQATPGSDASKAMAVQGVTGGKAVAVDGSGVTQPISAASLPLPSGAATSAAQTTAQTSLSSLVTNTTGVSTAANQTAPQANAGSDASKAIAVQGVTGAKAVGISIADGSDVTLGAQADVACATDNGTCTLAALIKRLNQRLTTLNSTLGSPFQAGGSIGNTAFTANAGTNLNTSALALDATLGTTNTDLGPPGATACATDTGSCSLNALLQRLAQRLTTVNTTLGTPMQATGGTVTANAGTNLNTSLLALESGGHLASVDTNTTTANTNLGAPGATACATDTSSCSINALLQRLAQRLTTVNSTLGSPMQATGGTVGLVAGSAIVGKVGVDQTTNGTTNGVALTSTTVSGSASSATTLSNFPVQNVGGASYFTVQWTVAGSGNVATYEGSNDNSSFLSLNCQASASNATNAITNVFTVSTSNPITCWTGGFAYLKVRLSTYGSGTPAATAAFFQTGLPFSFASIIGNPPVVGSVAAAGSDSGAPVKVGCKNNTSLPTYTDGQRTDCQSDTRGSMHVNIFDTNGSTGAAVVTPADGSGMSGSLRTTSAEAASNGTTWDVLRTSQGAVSASGKGNLSVEEAGRSFSNISTATTTTVKSGAGFLHLLTINTPVAGATITIYDNTAASGTKIGTLTIPSTITGEAPSSIIFDVAFATGLTIVTSGATDLTVSYR